MNRRELLKIAGITGLSSLFPSLVLPQQEPGKSKFRFCLNTATLGPHAQGVWKYIEITSKAGYDGIELWVKDVQDYLDSGKSIGDLKMYLMDSDLRVENAIGFAPCFVNDPDQQKAGLSQMQAEMELMAKLGCTRIAAPPAGLKPGETPDLFELGQRYKKVVDLGRKTGVMPQLEFWGGSETLYQFGQALMVAASADDPDVRILPDVFHMFRGNSGFGGLKMVSGNLVEIFHMNDYPGTIDRDMQTDADRVFPGDGIAPLQQIINDLRNMGGEKVLSLELFNPSYYMHDPLWIAQTGLNKMKDLVNQ